jgi:hypothetical protein
VALSTGTFTPVAEDARIFFTNGTGEIVLHVESKKETSSAIIEELKNIKCRCDRHNWSYPQYIICDNAAAYVKTVRKVFPNARIGQDLKHLINRPLETLSKGKEGSAEFFIDFHRAFNTGAKIVVKSRNGKVYKFDAPLDKPELMIERANKVISNYSAIYPDLIKPEFHRIWEIQKPLVQEYIFDPLADGMQFTQLYCFSHLVFV